MTQWTAPAKLIGLRRHRLLFRRCHRWSLVMATEESRDMTDHRPMYGIFSAALGAIVI